MRIIDADALIEGYKHMGYDPTEHPEESYMEGWCKGFNSATDHCMHHVIHAPTVEQPEQRWIPCSERLPKKNCRCLTTNEAWGSFEVDWNAWIDGQWLYPNEKPIAWMPLPESYRGGEKET